MFSCFFSNVLKTALRMVLLVGVDITTNVGQFLKSEKFWAFFYGRHLWLAWGLGLDRVCEMFDSYTSSNYSCYQIWSIHSDVTNLNASNVYEQWIYQSVFVMPEIKTSGHEPITYLSYLEAQIFIWIAQSGDILRLLATFNDMLPKQRRTRSCVVLWRPFSGPADLLGGHGHRR